MKHTRHISQNVTPIIQTSEAVVIVSPFDVSVSGATERQGILLSLMLVSLATYRHSGSNNNDATETFQRR